MPRKNRLLTGVDTRTAWHRPREPERKHDKSEDGASRMDPAGRERDGVGRPKHLQSAGEQAHGEGPRARRTSAGYGSRVASLVLAQGD